MFVYCSTIIRNADARLVKIQSHDWQFPPYTHQHKINLHKCITQFVNCATHLCKCNGVVYTLKIHPFLCYQNKYSNSTSTGLGINRGESQNWEELEPWPLAITKFCMVRSFYMADHKCWRTICLTPYSFSLQVRLGPSNVPKDTLRQLEDIFDTKVNSLSIFMYI